MSENIHWGRGSSCWQPSRHWLHRGLSFWHWCGQGWMGLSLWWPYGFRLPDLVYILFSLFIMNITEMKGSMKYYPLFRVRSWNNGVRCMSLYILMIGISLRIVLRRFHDLMFLLSWEIKNSWFLIPIELEGQGTRMWNSQELQSVLTVNERWLHFVVTHCDRVTHICVSPLCCYWFRQGLSPDRRQATVSTDDGLLSIGPLATCFNEILIR